MSWCLFLMCEMTGLALWPPSTPFSSYRQTTSAALNQHAERQLNSALLLVQRRLLLGKVAVAAGSPQQVKQRAQLQKVSLGQWQCLYAVVLRAARRRSTLSDRKRGLLLVLELQLRMLSAPLLLRRLRGTKRQSSAKAEKRTA